MTLNPTLLAVLACPSDDHAPLRERSQAGVRSLVCTYCATSFPIDNGIPVLLLDDATPGPNGIGVAAPAADDEAEDDLSPRHALADDATAPAGEQPAPDESR